MRCRGSTGTMRTAGVAPTPVATVASPAPSASWCQPSGGAGGARATALPKHPRAPRVPRTASGRPPPRTPGPRARPGDSRGGSARPRPVADSTGARRNPRPRGLAAGRRCGTPVCADGPQGAGTPAPRALALPPGHSRLPGATRSRGDPGSTGARGSRGGSGGASAPCPEHAAPTPVSPSAS